MDLSSLPATLFSPAKIVYVAYIVLASLDKIKPSVTEFFVVSLIFVVFQVFHDDYLRIKLNHWAQSTPASRM